MNDNSPTKKFDAEEAGRIHARKLINTLAIECPTAEAFTEAHAQARQALLELLDAADPAEVIEAARKNATKEERQRAYTDESIKRQKDRGSKQDPLFPPDRPKHWD